MTVSGQWTPQRRPRPIRSREFPKEKLEAPPGIEPGMEVLQPRRMAPETARRCEISRNYGRFRRYASYALYAELRRRRDNRRDSVPQGACCDAEIARL